MVIVSAAFRREKNPDWLVQQDPGVSKDVSSSQQRDHKSPNVSSVVSTSTYPSTDDEAGGVVAVGVKSKQDTLSLQRASGGGGGESLPLQRSQHHHELLQQFTSPSRNTVFRVNARLPPAPPPVPPPPPPPPPLETVLMPSAIMSTLSPMSHPIIQRSESMASSHNSHTLPAHAHWQSLRRFVVLSRPAPNDAQDAASYWTAAASLPKAPPFPKPKNVKNVRGVHACDDHDGVASLTSLLDSITSLCVGGEDTRKAYYMRRQQQQVQRYQRKQRHYSPQATYSCAVEDNSIIEGDNNGEDEGEDDGFDGLPPAAAVMLSRQQQQKQQQKQQQQQQHPTRSAQWSYRKSVVYPIASYPARLNSKTLVEQRRQELKQNSFFRPISDDEISIQPNQPQQQQQPKGQLVKHQHSF